MGLISTSRKSAALLKKFKILLLCLAFLALYIILNVHTFWYIIREFFYHGNFNIKLCYHFNDDTGSKHIPKIIHQVYLDTDISQDSAAFIDALHHTHQKCIEKNPDFQYKLWNNLMIEELLESCYPNVRPLYEKYRTNVDVVKNIARYVVVHSKGGMFVDLDFVCKRGMDELFHYIGNKSVVLSYHESPLGISNKFFLARKENEFMTHVLDGLNDAAAFYLAPFINRLFSTDSLFLLGRYLNYPHKDEVFLLPRSRSMAYLERSVYTQPWYAIDGKFVAIVWNDISPIQLLSLFLMVVFIIRLTKLIKIRKHLYKIRSRRRVRFYDSIQEVDNA